MQLEDVSAESLRPTYAPPKLQRIVTSDALGKAVSSTSESVTTYTSYGTS